MQSIKPAKEGEDDEEDIVPKDFIKIFKEDAVSDYLVQMINQEVNLRKRVTIRKKI